MGYWLGLACSSAAIPAFNLSPLTSQHGSPLTNKDRQCCGSSKQQHHPCFANRRVWGLMSRVRWMLWIEPAFRQFAIAWVIWIWNIRISRVASACGRHATSVSSARNHAGRRCKRLIHCGLVGVVRWLLCIAIATIRSAIRCVGVRVVWRVTLRGGIYLRRKRHCTYIHQNAYHNDMQRPVKEAIGIGKMTVFVSHDCI